ncbi:hypothetical protein BHE74_00053369 [Ensete ventricosum]|nr:hypothetical protein BHE74_00053369 [Ensete ventricosum]
MSCSSVMLMVEEAKPAGKGAMTSISFEARREYFRMSLYYPRYIKVYGAMNKAQLECILKQFGLPCHGRLEETRMDVMGYFLRSVD